MWELIEGEDVDDDGRANAIDNCTYVANPDQEDSDGDGWGDVCDGPGDMDHDADADLDDFRMFSTCLGGPGIDPIGGDCSEQESADADLNQDRAVDLSDWALFAAALTR